MWRCAVAAAAAAAAGSVWASYHIVVSFFFVFVLAELPSEPIEIAYLCAICDRIARTVWYSVAILMRNYALIIRNESITTRRRVCAVCFVSSANFLCRYIGARRLYSRAYITCIHDPACTWGQRACARESRYKLPSHRARSVAWTQRTHAHTQAVVYILLKTNNSAEHCKLISHSCARCDAKAHAPRHTKNTYTHSVTRM